MKKKEAYLHGCEFISPKREKEYCCPQNGLGKVAPDEIYSLITNKVLEVISQEKELVWKKPWAAKQRTGIYASNFVTKKPYKGINSFMLNLVYPLFLGRVWKTNYFLTFKQIEQMGGQLKKGSKGIKVFYYTFVHKKGNERISEQQYAEYFQQCAKEELEFCKDLKAFPVLKYYNVFSLDDVDGIKYEMPTPEKLNEKQKIDVAERIVQHFPEPVPKIIFQDPDAAYYFPAKDVVNMPPIASFNSEQAYYSTLFHELVHSTGSEKRLKRKFGSKKGTDYAFEELIAELGASYLNAEAGILHFQLKETAAYLKSWMGKLTDIMTEDNKFFPRAAAQAQQAADYILQYNAKGVPAYRQERKIKAPGKQLTLFKEVAGIGAMHIDAALDFIYRYRKLHNSPQTKESIGKLLAGLQQAIRNKDIRKTHPQAQAIEHIQEQLIGLYGTLKTKDRLTIELANPGKYDKILKSGLGNAENEEIEKLVEKAEPYRFLRYTYNNFLAEFGNDFSVQTPIGEAIIDIEQFEKIKAKDRDFYFGLIKPTLFRPLLIIKHEGNDLFIKSFIDKKRGVIYFVSVARNRKGEITVVSNHEKTENQIRKRLRDGDVRYKISSLSGKTRIVQREGSNKKTSPKYIFVYIGIPLTFSKKKRKKTSVKAKVQKKCHTSKYDKILKSGLGNAENEEIEKLVEKAEPYRFLRYTYNNFLAEFGNDFSVQTPIGEAIIDIEQFEKIDDRERKHYFGLIKPTLQNPLLIIKHRERHVFIKTFQDKKRGGIYFVSVTKNINGKIEVVSNHEKNQSSIVKKIKEGVVRYKISSLSGKTGFDTGRSPIKRTKYISIYIGIPLTFSKKKRKKTSVKAKVQKKCHTSKYDKILKAGLGKAEDGDFGPVYSQYKSKPKEAIKHLKRVKKGECPAALYRPDIGYIDIVWGENDPKTNKGFGLKHIIDKHDREIEQLGFKVEDFIPIVVQYGEFNESKSLDGKLVFESKNFRFVIQTNWKGRKKKWVLSAFNLTKKITKKTLGTIKTVHADGFTLGTLLQRTSANTKLQKPRQIEKSAKKSRAINGPETRFESSAPLLSPKSEEKRDHKDRLFFPANAKNIIKSPDTFRLPGEMGKFIGDIQPYKYAIVITGDPHAGKTEFATQLIDAFATAGKTVGLFSIEQGGLESKDTRAAIDRNVKPENQAKLLVSGDAPNGLDTLKAYAGKFDVIVVDSWQKLKAPAAHFDSLRHEHPGTIWVVIFQQNAEGGTKGGAAANYDAPVVVKVRRVDKDFSKNYAELHKNRGNAIDVTYLIKGKKTKAPEASVKEKA